MLNSHFCHKITSTLITPEVNSSGFFIYEKPFSFIIQELRDFVCSQWDYDSRVRSQPEGPSDLPTQNEPKLGFLMVATSLSLTSSHPSAT